MAQLPPLIISHYLIADNEEEMLRLKTDLGNDIIKHAKEELEQGDKIFTGGLRDSLHIEVEDPDRVSVIADAPNALPVEFGLAPYNEVNIDALRNWVKGKLGITDPKELQTVTYKIFNKIRNEGIPPTRFFKKSILRTVRGQGIKSAPRKKKSKLFKIYKKLSKYVKKLNKLRKHIKVSRRYNP